MNERRHVAVVHPKAAVPLRPVRGPLSSRNALAPQHRRATFSTASAESRILAFDYRGARSGRGLRTAIGWRFLIESDDLSDKRRSIRADPDLAAPVDSPTPQPQDKEIASTEIGDLFDRNSMDQAFVNKLPPLSEHECVFALTCNAA